MSLKPINELFYYPPRIFPERPTLDNFRMLFNLMKTTWVPFERYAFNTVFITLATTVGHVVLASMAAYPLAKMKIPFVRLFNNLILLSLMFVSAINDIANYLTITWLGWLDTYLAVIIPNIGASLGLFIMKNYMSTIPDTLLEAARIDGCSESGIYWRIVMPLAKPVWLTVVILMFQQIWSQNNSQYVYSEQLKTLPYALTQITSGGMVRMGAAQAVGVLMLLVPAVVFMFSQTRIIDTMATSGMKE
ncbi:MAG: carbohydrate ABC transporter permease, partial [Clostridiales bacterium]|nr:carbohydrate ABC transporter permease [Clostridiales bacterium]